MIEPRLYAPALRRRTRRQPTGHVIRAAVILVCFPFICLTARAADDAGSFVAHGLGNRPCSEWLESRARKDVDTFRMMAWTLGFISAYNKYQHKGVDVVGKLDASDIHAAIDKHCKSRPFDSLSFATNALIERLSDADDSSGTDWLLNLFGTLNPRR